MGQHEGLGRACATWCEEEQSRDVGKGRGHQAREVTPVILLPFAGRFIIHWAISRKLGRGVGVSNTIPASGVAELRSGREAGDPPWRGSGEQLAVGCYMLAGVRMVMPGELTTWVHTQSSLINSAACRAACFN